MAKMCIRDRYENFDKLTIAMLNEFIEKISVHERDRKGSIPVSYTHLGRTDDIVCEKEDG